MMRNLHRLVVWVSKAGNLSLLVLPILKVTLHLVCAHVVLPVFFIVSEIVLHFHFYLTSFFSLFFHNVVKEVLFVLMQALRFLVFLSFLARNLWGIIWLMVHQDAWVLALVLARWRRRWASLVESIPFFLSFVFVAFYLLFLFILFGLSLSSLDWQLFPSVIRHFGQQLQKLGYKDTPVALIIDNCDVHISLETIEEADRANIVLISLVKDTTAETQPLDRIVFGPFKIELEKAKENYIYQNGWILCLRFFFCIAASSLLFPCIFS